MSVRQGSSIIAIGNVAVDGDTTSFNANNSLQANGVMNKNTAGGATEKIYDWVGTLAEYTAQDIATNHPDWLCFITDDQASDFVDFADINASNFTNAGNTYLSGLGMPNVNRYETITVLASDSDYVAPANGYFFGQATATGVNGNIRFQYPNSEISGYMRVICWATSTGNYNLYVMCPVKKDESIKFGYSSCSNQKMWFVYAEGNGQ